MKHFYVNILSEWSGIAVWAVQSIGSLFSVLVSQRTIGYSCLDCAIYWFSVLGSLLFGLCNLLVLGSLLFGLCNLLVLGSLFSSLNERSDIAVWNWLTHHFQQCLNGTLKNILLFLVTFLKFLVKLNLRLKNSKKKQFLENWNILLYWFD